MKKLSMLALAGLCSMSFLTACSDNGSSAPSRSEACAKGLSEDCLVGTWSLKGVTDAGTGLLNPSHDFSAAPATITFQIITDEKGNKIQEFVYTLAANSKDECAKAVSNTVSGTWSISGASLSVVPMSTCYAPVRKSFNPAITVETTEIKMDMHELYFLGGDEMASADAGERAVATEVYTIGVN